MIYTNFYEILGSVLGMVLGRIVRPNTSNEVIMAKAKRQKAPKYTGVYFRFEDGGEDRTFYILYRKGGREAKLIEEPVGKASSGMTAAKASQIRADRVRGREPSNTERRKSILESKKLANSKCTLDKIWEAYKDAHPEHRSKPKDISRYNAHIANRFGNRCPEDLLTSDIDLFKKESLEAGKSPGTIQRVITQLRAIINFGVKRGLCPAINPQRLSIESIHVDNKKPEMLSDEHIHRLNEALDAEKDQDAVALMRLAMLTGMRKGALLGLRWDDCDFEHNLIRLRGECAKNGITDYIPMSDHVRSILEKINRIGSQYVFPGRDGGKRKDFRRIARRVKKEAKLPDDFRPLHGMRHLFASTLASSGEVDLATLQQLLTHATPKQTEWYIKLADEYKRKAANLAGEILTKKRDKGNG